jgi:hypothetical protein
LIALVAAFSLEAQEKQRIAVIPFNPINIPKDEAEVVYKDFEASLTATNAYVLIDREEIIQLLGGGESSLFSCTNESCALHIAANVAADRVIRGSLWRGETGYVLKIQIVDVSTKSIVFLEKVSERFLSRMRDSMNLLAHKVAGLVVVKSGNYEIARQFTEVFVDTSPSRADIYVNGIEKGTSPDLISRVPLGRITISARYGNFYGEQTLNVTADTRTVHLECREVYGNLEIQTGHDLDVYLDGRWLGKASDGPFKNLPIGIHKLELKGEGLYWREVVTLRSDRQTVVEAQPEPYGRIEYGIPDGATAEITGEMFREVVVGYGTLPVPVGVYSTAVTGKNYESYQKPSLTVSQEEVVTLQPVLEYTKDYERRLFMEQIEEAERSIQYGYRPSTRDIQELRNLKQAIMGSKHEFPNLLSRVETLIETAERILGIGSVSEPETEQTIAEKERRLNELLAQKQELELRLESSYLARRRRRIAGWTSFGLSMASAGVAGVFYYFANDAYRDYQTAPPSETEEKKKLVKLWDTATIAALGTSGGFLLLSSIFWVARPSANQLNEELDSLESQIE